MWGGSGGGNSSSDNDSSIRDNQTPMGLSSFALGLSKFPVADGEQLGFKSVVKSVRRIATNELYTFPEKITDRTRVPLFISELISSGREVVHEIHILSGPSMRRSGDWWINEITGYKTSDKEFVNLFLHNDKIKDAVSNLFAEVVDYARGIESLGAEVIICPELEDNQTNESFAQMLSVLDNLGWSRQQIVRNSVKYDFEQHLKSFPDIRFETHTRNVLVVPLRPGDIYNNDGTDFYFNSDESKPSWELSEDYMRAAFEWAQIRGVIMFAHQMSLQGIISKPSCYSCYDGTYTNRNYTIQKPLELIAMLQGK